MATKVLDLNGTSKSSFFVQKGGALLKNNAGDLVVRDYTDSADAEVTASQVNISGDTLVINSDAAGSGSDWVYNVSRPSSGMSGDVDFVLPPTEGSAGQVLSTDGNGATSWVTVSTDATVTVDVTSFSYSDTFPLAMFTLPANSVVAEVTIITDTDFDDAAATVSVGVSGNASKYGATSDFDVTGSAGDVWTATDCEGIAPVGTTQALELACSPGTSAQGAGRVLVKYYIPQ